LLPSAEADAEEPSILILNSSVWSPRHLSTEHRNTRTSYYSRVPWIYVSFAYTHNFISPTKTSKSI